MIHRAKVTIPIIIFIFSYAAKAQPLAYCVDGDSITIAANPNLQTSGFNRFLFGSLWRNAWVTPVKTKIWNPYSSDGNFTFDTILSRTHQGSKTISFLFKGKDGKDYTFTPFTQDSASSLPLELSMLLPRNIVADQMSTLNPYAPLVVVPILQAINLPYRNTQLIFIQDTDSLSKDSLQIKGMSGILESQWYIPHTDSILFQNNLFETSAMLESLDSDLNCRVDELQYLKARLVDILLGDWDRSADQWRWFKVQNKANILWEPIPLIHQQAFVRLNGLLPTIADLALPQLQHCDESISSVENLTLTGCVLDRRLLISFPKQTWDSLTSWVQANISDSILIKAIANLPIPILEEEGKSILQLLQARRAQLTKATDEFYKLLSAYVEIHGTNKAEFAEIRRIGRHMVSVALYDRFDTSHVPIYQRLFHDDLTKEIRVLLLGGNDVTSLEGEESSTIKIIVDGGYGKNELVDKSKSRSIFSSLNPFYSSGTVFYDNDSAIPSLSVNEKERSGKTLPRNWGSEWSFNPWLDMNPDDLLFIGGGPVFTQYGYRLKPYSEQISVRAGVATKTMRYRFDASGEFRDWFRGVRAFFQLHASQLDLSNFFGLGNETSYNHSLEKTNFYKVDQRQIFLNAALGFTIADNTSAAIGSTIKLIDNNPKSGTLLDTLQFPYYNKSLTFLNFTARIQTDSRNDEILPTQGLYAKTELSIIPKIFDNAELFYKLRSDVRLYFTLNNSQLTTLSVRTAGEKIWGKHPFFESSFLGGSESLRGFERQRFAGDASLLVSTELRARLVQIPFLVPLWAGVSGFAETGRVFLNGENSNRWHNIIGGGVWFSFIKPEYIVNLSLARSEDEFALYATLGFMY